MDPVELFEGDCYRVDYDYPGYSTDAEAQAACAEAHGALWYCFYKYRYATEEDCTDYPEYGELNDYFSGTAIPHAGCFSADGYWYKWVQHSGPHATENAAREACGLPPTGLAETYNISGTVTQWLKPSGGAYARRQQWTISGVITADPAHPYHWTLTASFAHTVWKPDGSVCAENTNSLTVTVSLHGTGCPADGWLFDFAGWSAIWPAPIPQHCGPTPVGTYNATTGERAPYHLNLDCDWGESDYVDYVVYDIAVSNV